VRDTVTSDVERLRRLLGGADLEPLRRRLRVRFERGEPQDAFTLADLTLPQRRALEGLLGRAPKTASSMQLSRAELDTALSRAGLADGLRDALELLDGPITDRYAERALQDQLWNDLVDSVSELRLRALMHEPGGLSLLKRFSAGDAERASELLTQTESVLARIPALDIPLALLAAGTLGDSHALDAGRPAATLALRACFPLSGIDGQTPERPIREKWAELGVSVNELAAPVLALNLPAVAGSACGDMILAATRYGEPLHLSLRLLLRSPVQWSVSGRSVFVCENPSIVATAAEQLGARCAPLVCTDGMPGAAQRTLLRQLAAAGARLHYHGDFDWGGIRIANFVVREFGARAWKLGADDYLTAGAEAGLPLPMDQRVEASWDARLGEEMARLGFAVHEERVVARLLEDLDASI